MCEHQMHTLGVAVNRNFFAIILQKREFQSGITLNRLSSAIACDAEYDLLKKRPQ